jgi:hypothetical protein
MKKQIFKASALFLLALLATVTAYAQGSDRVWSIGPEVGVNFSKWGGDADESDYKAGLVAGGFVTYSIRDTYGFTAKVLFSQKGAAYTEDGGLGDDVDVKTQLNYIEIPILARVFFNREGDVRPNVFLGPSFGFLTGAKFKVEDEDYEDIEDYKDSFNTFDAGLAAGLGLNIRVGGEMYLIVDARYTYGLSDIGKGSGSFNNQAVAVTAGLSFGIGN